MLFIQSAWAQDAAGAIPPTTLSAVLVQWGWLPLVMAVFYFLVFRPQAQQAKAQAAMLAALAKGDVVETAGGVIGTVAKVAEKFVELTAGGGANQVTLVLSRAAVLRKLTSDEIKLTGIKK